MVNVATRRGRKLSAMDTSRLALCGALVPLRLRAVVVTSAARDEGSGSASRAPHLYNDDELSLGDP